jgi:protein-tyrosine phosphatase
MAEALLAARLRGRSPPVEVRSAGLGALVGRPAEPLARALLEERGLDLSRHRARQLTEDLAEWADLILVMEPWHLRAVEGLSPSSRGRVQRLGRFGNFDVPDPFRRDRAAFELALSLIERGVDQLVEAFWARPR